MGCDEVIDFFGYLSGIQHFVSKILLSHHHTSANERSPTILHLILHEETPHSYTFIYIYLPSRHSKMKLFYATYIFGYIWDKAYPYIPHFVKESRVWEAGTYSAEAFFALKSGFAMFMSACFFLTVYAWGNRRLKHQEKKELEYPVHEDAGDEGIHLSNIFNWR